MNKSGLGTYVQEVKERNVGIHLGNVPQCDQFCYVKSSVVLIKYQRNRSIHIHCNKSNLCIGDM